MTMLHKIHLGNDSSGRPVTIDARTYAKFEAACDRLDFALTIVQGSYRGSSGAAASAGTHDGGGVIDIRVWDLPARITPQAAVRALRQCGFIAWYRTRAQGFDPHIHAIDYGNPDLAPAAARQVTAYEAGRNGLASNGPDDGPRVPIPKTPPTQKDWFDMASKKDLETVVRAVVRDELKSVDEAAAKAVQRIVLGGQPDAPDGRYLGATLSKIARGVDTLLARTNKKE